jgi:two-component system, NtrC family, sensor kinase
MKEPNTPKETDFGEEVCPFDMFKVLIVADSEMSEESQELLNALTMAGHHIASLDVITCGTGKSAHQQGVHPDYLLDDLKKRLEVDPPDILILTLDDQELRNGIKGLAPPKTRIFGPFVLKIIRGLKDVSRQLASARTRLQSLELMKHVLMSGPETSIMVVDEDLKIVEINSAILERTRMSQEDCVGKPCHWVIHKEMSPCYCKGEECAVQAAIQKGQAVITVREELRKDGSIRYFTINSYPLPKDERGKKNVMIVWRDVSKQMKPVLNRQARSIRESFTHTLRQDKMTALGKLASAAAHEINNPIQGILVFAKLMRQAFEKKSLTEEEMERFRSYLDLMSVESERCGRIVQGLLSFSRKKDLKKTAVDLTKIFEDIALLVGNRIKIQGISLRIENSQNTQMVHCDGDQIKQAFLNIVLNSVEAMPSGGLITVSTEPRPEEKQVVVRIRDTGPGIPKDVQDKLFEPFFTTKTKGKGTGLGLSVVYGIMWQHGANIEVESKEGEGTTFVITLNTSSEHVL